MLPAEIRHVNQNSISVGEALNPKFYPDISGQNKFYPDRSGQNGGHGPPYDYGVKVDKMCCGSALNWRENATEKLQKCAEKVMIFDKK